LGWVAAGGEPGVVDTGRSGGAGAVHRGRSDADQVQ
jgi:hypothetical protein